VYNYNVSRAEGEDMLKEQIKLSSFQPHSTKVAKVPRWSGAEQMREIKLECNDEVTTSVKEEAASTEHYYYVHDLVDRVKKTERVVYTLRSGNPFPQFSQVQQHLANSGYTNLWHRWQVVNCNDKPHLASHTNYEILYSILTSKKSLHGTVGMTKMPKLKKSSLKIQHAFGKEMLTISEIATKYNVKAATVRARSKAGKVGMELVSRSPKGKIGDRYEVSGEMLTVQELSWRYMINVATVRARIKRGVTGADIVA
jgi:hypothetical protein